MYFLKDPKEGVMGDNVSPAQMTDQVSSRHRHNPNNTLDDDAHHGTAAYLWSDLRAGSGCSGSGCSGTGVLGGINRRHVRDVYY